MRVTIVAVIAIVSMVVVDPIEMTLRISVLYEEKGSSVELDGK